MLFRSKALLGQAESGHPVSFRGELGMLGLILALVKEEENEEAKHPSRSGSPQIDASAGVNIMAVISGSPSVSFSLLVGSLSVSGPVLVVVEGVEGVETKIHESKSETDSEG